MSDLEDPNRPKANSPEADDARVDNAELETSEVPEAGIDDPQIEDVTEHPAPPTPLEKEEKTAPEPVAAAKPKGRGLAVLACLLALLAVGGVGYLYYELVYLKPLAAVSDRSAQLQSDYQNLRTELTQQITTLEASTQSAMEKVVAEQQQKLASNEDAVIQSLNEALTAAPPSQREWKIAEAEYLLRIANHRVLMEQDSVGALDLLMAADQIMVELDDFALHQVRAMLADEIIALRQVPKQDIQGVYLRLEAIKEQLNNLPLPEPVFREQQTENAPEQTAWQSLAEEFKKFFRFRTLSGEEAIKPLLAPDEIQYLSLNLRLALEQAQLATLKRQQEVYEQSLLNVRGWLVDHADTTDPRTKAMLTSIDELMLLELAAPMPDISSSLTELLSIRRSGS